MPHCVVMGLRNLILDMLNGDTVFPSSSTPTGKSTSVLDKNESTDSTDRLVNLK